VSSVFGAGNVPVREAELGVTACDCLVAQTGSVFVTTRAAGGRALSVLPPAHLVIARRDQLVPDLPAAFARLRARYGTHWPSALSLITGPSRTSDIEKTLVLGAHGPKRLAVYFADA
jgi:L-lactate dehydrogenase complex protein LldG